MKGRRLWAVGFLAFMTNGASLLGCGAGSAGAVARSIEFNHNLARNIELAKALEVAHLAGNPPTREESETYFGPFEVDCSALNMCSVLA